MHALQRCTRCIEQPRHRFASQGFFFHGHRGQRWVRRRGRCDVVVAADPDVLGNTQSPALTASERDKGGQIVEGKDGVGWVRQIQKLIRTQGRCFRLVKPVPVIGYVVRVGEDASIEQRLAITALAQVYRVVADRPRDESDALVAVSRRC